MGKRGKIGQSQNAKREMRNDNAKSETRIFKSKTEKWMNYELQI